MSLEFFCFWSSTVSIPGKNQSDFKNVYQKAV